MTNYGLKHKLNSTHFLSLWAWSSNK